MGFFRRSGGVPAQARIVEMGPTAKGARQTNAHSTEFRFRLAVTTSEGSTFETDHVCKVPDAKMPLPNDTLPVEIDPDQRSVLRIDFDAMPDLAARARASAAAAKQGDSAGAAEALGYRLRDES